MSNGWEQREKTFYLHHFPIRLFPHTTIGYIETLKQDSPDHFRKKGIGDIFTVEGHRDFSLSVLGIWSSDGLGSVRLIIGLHDVRHLFQWFHDPVIFQRFLLLLGHPGPAIGQDRLQEQLHVLVRQHLWEERERKGRRHLFLFKPALWDSGHIFL